jgi:Alpha amylase, catalytic domain
MQPWNRFPLVYEINTRAWLANLTLRYGHRVTLADVPDEEFRKWRALHFDAIWLMGVWQPSERSRQLALSDPEMRVSFARALTDWKPEDVASSPYSVAGYSVAESLGGNAALAEFREKLKAHSIKLMLDFVPNHTAVEHPWVTASPDFYIQIRDKTRHSIDAEACFETEQGQRFACGRLLDSAPWKDTLQLDYSNANLQDALIDTLRTIAHQCDGVRCDTAITALKDVFHRTWGELAGCMETEFWDKAIEQVKKEFSNFLFLAEVYGEFEWQLQQLGFDFVYDKVLYDRLTGYAPAVAGHLHADWEFARKLARFTENHDWRRAAEVFGRNNKAASLLTLSLPGLRIVHEGQMEGWRKQLPVYLIRQPVEETDREISIFYHRLLSILNHPAVVNGEFHPLDLHSETAVGFERRYGSYSPVVCLVKLGEPSNETAFSTDAFAQIEDYQQVHIVSTDLLRSPQFDLWPGGITVRLRGHEGLLFSVPQ